MAATAKNIQNSYEKIKADPKCAILIPLIVPAIQAGEGEGPDGGMDWVVSWTAFEKMADDAHTAHLIPGALGKKYKQLYSDQSKVASSPLTDPSAATHEIAQAMQPTTESGGAVTLEEVEAEEKPTPQEKSVAVTPDLSDNQAAVLPAQPLEMVKVASYEEVAQSAEAEQSADAGFGEPTPEGEPDETADVPPMTTWFPLSDSNLAVLVAVASEFKSADNVPYAISGNGINVKDDDAPKVVKLFTHLSEHSERITSVPSRDLVCDACKAVLSELEGASQ